MSVKYINASWVGRHMAMQPPSTWTFDHLEVADAQITFGRETSLCYTGTALLFTGTWLVTRRLMSLIPGIAALGFYVIAVRLDLACRRVESTLSRDKIVELAVDHLVDHLTDQKEHARLCAVLHSTWIVYDEASEVLIIKDIALGPNQKAQLIAAARNITLQLP